MARIPPRLPRFSRPIRTYPTMRIGSATSRTEDQVIVMTTERSSDSVLRVHVKEDSENEIGEIQDLDAGEFTGDQSLRGSEAVKGQRSRGKDPAEREKSKLKRLLRNRVSAQQARERKKVYVNELEKRVKDLEEKDIELEEKHTTLQKENHMLRHIIKNTTSSSSR